jgi:hypothetical protein
MANNFLLRQKPILQSLNFANDLSSQTSLLHFVHKRTNRRKLCQLCQNYGLLWPRSWPPTDKTISIIVFVGLISPRRHVRLRQRFPALAMREMRGFGQTPCLRTDLRVRSPRLSEARESPKNPSPEAQAAETELGLPVRSTTS